MSALDLSSRLSDPDAAYRALIEAHRGLTDEESAALNTALVLVLANQVGSLELLIEAISESKSVVTSQDPQN